MWIHTIQSIRHWLVREPRWRHPCHQCFNITEIVTMWNSRNKAYYLFSMSKCRNTQFWVRHILERLTQGLRVDELIISYTATEIYMFSLLQKRNVPISTDTLCKMGRAFWFQLLFMHVVHTYQQHWNGVKIMIIRVVFTCETVYMHHFLRLVIVFCAEGKSTYEGMMEDGIA